MALLEEPWKVVEAKTILLLCTWKIFVAPKPEGPYTELPLHGSLIANSTRKGVFFRGYLPTQLFRGSAFFPANFSETAQIFFEL